jgi:acyl dehydratase
MGAAVKAEGAAGLTALVGRSLGPGDWHPVSMRSVRMFATVTGDDQWIHLDEERARREGPFGGAVAQGNLTLAKADCLADELIDWSGFSHVLHRGWLHASYLAPVVLPGRIRVSIQIDEARQMAGGWWEVERDLVVEAEGAGPACEARSLTALLEESQA